MSSCETCLSKKRYVYWLFIVLEEAIADLQALDRFRLPINVTEGHLGELVLQIPWSNLKSKPVKVVIEDVFLLAEPKLDEEYDPEEEERRDQAVKLERLENLDLMESSAPAGANLSPEEIKKNQSFTESLVTKIVDNLQVTIKNIHIRYEDFSSVPHHPFSLGFTLAELSAVSTDDNWDPIFIQDVTDLTRKLATLSSLSIYWDTDAKTIQPSGEAEDDDEETTVEKFRSLMSAKAKHQYILSPVSGVGRIVMNKFSTDKEPKTRAQLVFEELGFAFDSDQYRDCLCTAELFRLYNKTKDFKRFRPAESPKEEPREWLQYAAKVVLQEIHRKNEQWSWEYMKGRIEQRHRYIDLYKEKETNSTLEPEKQEQFDQLQWDLSFDDLRLYRSIAKSQLRKERAKAPSPPAAKQAANQGWGAWLWGSSNKSADEDDSTQDEVQMTDEQRQELYDAIEWDGEAHTTASDLPDDRVTLELECALRTGSFTLREDPHGKSSDIAAVFFNGFRATFFQRPSSFLTNISLREFRVDDKSKETLYEQVVTVKNISHLDDHKELDSGSDNDDSDSKSGAMDEDVFFWLSFENNPLDGSADSSLFVRTKSITIFYNTKFIENIAYFFRPPQTHLETIGAIMNAAGATVEGLREQSRIGLEYALEQHKTANIKLDIKAPLIVIPLDSTTWDTPCAVIDAGHVSVLSDLVKREVLDEVKNKQTQKYTDKDWKQLEDLMYDKFNLQLHDTQILLGPNVRDTMKLCHDNDLNNPAYVVGRVNMDFILEVSILPNATSLTRFKVSGNLPLFKAAMSDKKYKLMMTLIDKAIPNLSFADDQSSGVLSDDDDFNFSRQDASLGDDFQTNSLHSDSQSDISGSATVAPSASGSTYSVSATDQKLFEFKFRVERVELELNRCTDEKTLAQEPLVDLVLENFTLDFYYKKMEMYAHVTLERLNVEDYVEANVPDDLKRIVTSDHVHSIYSSSDKSVNQDGTPGTTDLFEVKYKRIMRASTAGTDNEISDQTVDISLSTLQFVVAPKTFLVLLDFIITTFTNPEEQSSATAADSRSQSDQDDSVKSIAAPPPATGEIDVNVNLKGIILTLNDDGIKLATLQLETAVVGVRLVNETMKIVARVGSLELHDDVNEGSPRDGVLRKLVSIEGDDLADFTYQTFDSQQKNDYDSSIYFRAGSIKVSVVEEPMTKIVNFLSRFQEMKALFDATRLAAMNQAVQIEAASRISFDVLVRTPIVVFPKPKTVASKQLECDNVTANLGEIFINNSFENNVNAINAGIRSVRMTSCFHFENEIQILEILDNVDLVFEMAHIQDEQVAQARGLPLMRIKGDLSDINMCLTDCQYRYIVEMSRTVSSIFSGQSGMDAQERDQLEEELMHSKRIERHVSSISESSPDAVDAKLKGRQTEIQKSGENGPLKVDLKFNANMISLTIFSDTENVGHEDIQSHSLSCLALNQTAISVVLGHDNSLSSALNVHSLTVSDTRKIKENKFPEIIPGVDHDEHQFLCKYSRNGTGRRQEAHVSIDSPKMILALDYLFALKTFVSIGDTAIGGDEEDDYEDDDDDVRRESSEVNTTLTDLDAKQGPDDGFFVEVNIVDASLILLADAELKDSEAIVLKTDQLLYTQGHSSSLAITNVGVFLCKMDKFDQNRLRILDNFSVTASIDDRSSDSTHLLTKIQIAVEPLLLRLSMRDILMALSIVSKAGKLSEATDASAQSDTGQYAKFSGTSGKRIGSTLRSKSRTARSTSISKRRSSTAAKQGTDFSRVTVRAEELFADFDGMRLVIIGMAHELPIIDSCVKPFTVVAKNWSSDLRIDASTEMFSNIFNISKSAWEPLVESWDIGFHLSRTSLNNNTFVNFFSRKLMEITVTSQTIDTITGLVEYLSNQPSDGVITKPRETSAPYRIKNETGYDIEVSPNSTSNDVYQHTAIVKDGEEIPWQFVDWRVLREHLSTDEQQIELNVKLLDSPFDPIIGLSVTSEGEELYILQPKQSKISHRLSCTITIEDSLKKICIGTAYKFRNDTNVDLQLRDTDKNFSFSLASGKTRYVPLQYLLTSTIMVRPEKDLGFDWCQKGIYWENISGKEEGATSASLMCQKKSEDSTFYIQADANYDPSAPLTRYYPYMTIYLSAPLEVVNMLPYDFKYRLYSKNDKKDWLNTLGRGERSPVHVVSLQHLLLLSVHVEEAGYDKSEFAVVNAPKSNEFKREFTLLAHRTGDGQRLKLRLHYYKPPGRSGYHIVVYSPYVILNKTGLDLQVGTRQNTATSHVISTELSTVSEDPEDVSQHATSHIKSAVPLLWSFDNFDNRSNRAIIKVGDSKWSGPQSFEAIGTVNEVTIPSKKQTNVHVGTEISEGTGRYKLTKVVSISPRFIFVSKLKEDIQVRDPEGSSSEALTVQAGNLQAFHYLRQGKTQVIAAFAGAGSQWSAPFDINTVGTTYVKIHKPNKGFLLFKIDILLEGPTLFIHLDDAGKSWPYSVRNFTNFDFIFFQANPYVDAQGVEQNPHPPFTPIRYRIPAKSVMPYSWDFPAAAYKELVISYGGRERRVQLQEIGSLPPMKLPRSSSGARTGIVDLDVIADGPLVTLVITDYDPQTSMYQLKKTQTNSSVNNSTSAVGSSSDLFSVVGQDDESEDVTSIKVNFEGVGISLINKRLAELCYITLRGFEFHFKSSQLYDTFSMKMKWMQIDNQLFGGVFPVILFPSIVPKSGDEMEAHPTFSAAITRVKDDTHGVLFIKYATMLLQEITLEMDEDFLFSLMDFVKAPFKLEETEKLCDQTLQIPAPLRDNSGMDVYFEVLHIQPAQMDLSFVRTERINVEDRPSGQTALTFFFNILTMAIGNINDAPVKLNALMLENVHTPIPLLMQTIQTHYSQEFIYQIHRILGSADFLGNPVGLFSNISSGFMDMFYEPYLGYIHSDRPQDLGIGIAKGGVSFAKKTVFGVSDSIAKLTGSISKGLAVATMDQNYQSRRRLQKNRNKPQHALYGLSSGATSFVDGISSGVSGLALSPLEGASKDGAAGFFRGLGKGLVGLPTKTAIGIFDLASNVSEGVRNTTTVFDGNQIPRVRPTRFIEHDGVVRPFNDREAVGQTWLKAVNEGQYFNDEYLAHLNMNRDNIVAIVSFSRVIVMSTATLKTEWEVQFQHLQTIVMERTGIALVLRGGVQGPFMPIPNADSRQFLYREMGIAVKEFNRKHQTLS